MAGRATVYYDLYDCDKYIGRYPAAEIMDMLDIRRYQQIIYYSDAGSLYLGRYLFVRSLDEAKEKVIEEIIQVGDNLRAIGCDLSCIKVAQNKNPHKKKRQPRRPTLGERWDKTRLQILKTARG